MSEPFIGEIRLYPFNFAPRNWALCQGQLLAISQNTALFSLLGTNFGGDGRSSFGLPDLRGAVPAGAGQGPGLSAYSVGQTAGAATVTLNQSQMPSHNHTFNADTAEGTATASSNALLAKAAKGPRGEQVLGQVYSPNGPNVAMAPLGASGGGQPHNNMQPYLTLNYCIALAGVFPIRP